ncbi:LOB domain-containing protein 41 [Abeliophyllum distichum]|uniref:LOB domain-containing protein 41 n=1 Tax=Abeliophyllum distichum TaxID=126358 RepID=A0ABD1VQC6_9LAMI
MRMSCNGCRVLRKACGETCTIRPCLQWIKTSEAQSNATVFLAKFYGRAGLLNLINSGPEHLQTAIFRSLLHEACGRIVNPITGATGLLWSGNWHLCQAAVEAVLSGASVAQVSSESVVSTMKNPPFKAGDIRHVSKDDNPTARECDVHKIKTRGRFKKVAAKPKLRACSLDDVDNAARVMWSWSHKEEEAVGVTSQSHGSGVSQGENVMQPSRGSEIREDDSASVETVEASLTKPVEPTADGSGVELELTLGIEPVARNSKVGPLTRDEKIDGCEEATRFWPSDSCAFGL